MNEESSGVDVGCTAYWVGCACTKRVEGYVLLLAVFNNVKKQAIKTSQLLQTSNHSRNSLFLQTLLYLTKSLLSKRYKCPLFKPLHFFIPLHVCVHARERCAGRKGSPAGEEKNQTSQKYFGNSLFNYVCWKCF